ncbi:hypothetical protein GCM10023091_35330 [Ravibacter arvi]|uniref:DUF6089 domain-containing protein n=1 Tax=Ravibacter arvi TaxID=2051041 RepID=A0ABP8M571_9BACT
MPTVFGQKWEVGAGVGGMNYTGDIARKLQIRNFRPAGNLFARYNLKNGFSFRAEFLGGGIAAADRNADNAFQQQRDLSFKTLVLEGNLATEYNFLDYRDSRKALNWTPYVMGGIGYALFRPKPDNGSYKTSTLVIPFGVGLKYQVKRPWGVGVEFSARKTFTDYLDNFGGKEVVPDKFGNGNPALKDIYYFLGVNVSYTFYKIVCP